MIILRTTVAAAILLSQLQLHPPDKSTPSIHNEDAFLTFQALANPGITSKFNISPNSVRLFKSVSTIFALLMSAALATGEEQTLTMTPPKPVVSLQAPNEDQRAMYQFAEFLNRTLVAQKILSNQTLEREYLTDFQRNLSFIPENSSIPFAAMTTFNTNLGGKLLYDKRTQRLTCELVIDPIYLKTLLLLINDKDNPLSKTAAISLQATVIKELGTVIFNHENSFVHESLAFLREYETKRKDTSIPQPIRDEIDKTRAAINAKSESSGYLQMANFLKQSELFPEDMNRLIQQMPTERSKTLPRLQHTYLREENQLDGTTREWELAIRHIHGILKYGPDVNYVLNGQYSIFHNAVKLEIRLGNAVGEAQDATKGRVVLGADNKPTPRYMEYLRNPRYWKPTPEDLDQRFRELEPPTFWPVLSKYMFTFLALGFTVGLALFARHFMWSQSKKMGTTKQKNNKLKRTKHTRHQPGTTVGPKRPPNSRLSKSA